MKKQSIKLIWIYIVLLMPISSLKAQENKTLFFTLNAASASLIPTKWVIERYRFDYQLKKTETVWPKSMKTVFSSNLLEPEYWVMKFYFKNKKITEKSFWVEPNHYSINLLNNKIDFDQKKSIALSSVENLSEQINIYQNKIDSSIKKVDYENRKISDVENEIAFKEDSVNNYLDHEIYLKTFQNNKKSVLGLFALIAYANRPRGDNRVLKEPEKIDSLFELLDDEIKKLPSAKNLQERLNIGKKLSIGNTVSDFELPDKNGIKHKISDFKGKYVLIDFWASWCGPCREEGKYLLNAYQKYNQHGFMIYSITLDNKAQKSEWLSAVKDDKIDRWLQLSDFEKLAQKKFNVSTIPANFLIDKTGKIVATNLRGAQLEDELKRIFKL